MKLVHWPLMGGLLHLVHRGGDWAGLQPAQAVPNVTAHPSKASVPITILLYNGPVLCGFNVPVKGLITRPVGRCITTRLLRCLSSLVALYVLIDCGCSVLVGNFFLRDAMH